MALSCTTHGDCVAQALAQAEAACRAQDARLTATRRQVLELLWRSHQPRKAYDILAELSRDDRTAKPPTVYRALDFLQGLGLVHKVESLNAYIGCGAGKTGIHGHQYLICTKCGTVADIQDDALSQAIAARAAADQFRPDRAIVEITGLCGRC